jgi:transposase-like protein
MNSELATLRALWQEDPIAFSGMDGDDPYCFYCGSEETIRDGWKRAGHLHFKTCPWLLYARITDLDVKGEHRVYVPPEPKPPCPDCGLQYVYDDFARVTSTGGPYEAHIAHLAAAEGLTVWEYAKREADRTFERLQFTAARIALPFLIPPMPVTEWPRSY